MGLDQQYRWFVESVYALSSLPVSQRSLGPRMGDLRPAHPTRQARRAFTQVADAQDAKRHLLSLEKRLPVAHASTRVPSMVYGAPLFQDRVALGRHLGEDQRAVARKDPPTCGPRSPTERRDPGYPVREDHQRWRRARIRWSEEIKRKKAPSSGGYARDGAQGYGARGGPPG
jgi:hypothetical protein